MNEAKKVLVVGGGIAGLTAAWELANLKTEVLLVDQGPFLGGRAAYFACKATDRCLKCNNCLVEQRLREVVSHPGINVVLNSRLASITRRNGAFEVSISQGPRYIDPEKCTDCGRCFEVCPGRFEGAIEVGPSAQNHPFYAIYPERCPCEPEARLCQKACPEEAIDLDRQGAELTVTVDGVVLATGYTPFDPRQKVALNFEKHPNMITGLELESRLRQEGMLLRPSDGQPPRTVAFIQCVGSRDRKLAHNFCSRVCCGYALRLGLRLTHAQPDIQVAVFYMDIQNFGKDFDRLLREAKGRFRFIRALPGEYNREPDGGITLRYFNNDTQTAAKETFDLVVLSVGLMPALENQALYQLLGVAVDEHGFAVPNPAGGDGVVVAGTVEGPMDIAESITHAARAAHQLARQLGVLP